MAHCSAERATVSSHTTGKKRWLRFFLPAEDLRQHHRRHHADRKDAEDDQRHRQRQIVAGVAALIARCGLGLRWAEAKHQGISFWCPELEIVLARFKPEPVSSAAHDRHVPDAGRYHVTFF